MNDWVGMLYQVLAITAGLGLYALCRILRFKRPVKARPQQQVPPPPFEPKPAAFTQVLAQSEMDRLVTELNTALKELRTRQVAPTPVPPSVGIARGPHLRTEVLRLSGMGMDSWQVSARLLIPPAEAEFLLRVSRLGVAHAEGNCEVG